MWLSSLPLWRLVSFTALSDQQTDRFDLFRANSKCNHENVVDFDRKCEFIHFWGFVFNLKPSTETIYTSSFHNTLKQGLC